jgi:hypothetical protein
VLHCPSSVGGNPQGLARAEREIGLASHCVAFRESPFGYEIDEVLAAEGTSPLRAEARRWRLLLRALRGYDVVHFNFGRTILPSLDSIRHVRESVPPAAARVYAAYARLLEFRDLPVLRRAGKVIAVTFQGDDARQGDFCRANFEVEPASEVEPGYYTPQSDARRRRVVDLFDRHADLIYALNPDLFHVLPERARFLPYAHVDLRSWKAVGVDLEPGRPPRLTHAPTHRGIKGTRHLLRAVEELRSQGVRFEFELVEGVSHDEARRRFARTDLLVDQLLLGSYGGLAVELMALGKPVVCYMRASDLGCMPEAMARELPLIHAAPAQLVGVLRDWLTRPRSALAEQGRRSRLFVERWHDPLRIARELAADYERALVRRDLG